jgi:hypothetical protein
MKKPACSGLGVAMLAWLEANVNPIHLGAVIVFILIAVIGSWGRK